MESRPPAARATAFRVGEWTVRSASGRIEREGVARHLRPMLMEILVLLSEQAGTVVSKERVLERVWSNRLVGESTLSRDIAVLRRLLGDDARHPRYIETISKRGFRLVAQVAALPESQLRVGVLPFANLNPDAAWDYLAEGFADALTTELARLPGMLVISRQSMLHFRGASQTIREIAAELHASAVVEGSFTQFDDRIRLTAQLVDGLSDVHLWAETYEAEKATALAGLGRVAGRFAHAIHSKLGYAAEVGPGQAADVIAAANVEYLKYRYHFGKWTEEGLHKGLAHLRQALEIDPTFAKAYSGFAWALTVLGYWGFMPIEDAYPKAKGAAARSISLEPSSEAHAALALVKWLYEWDLDGAWTEIKCAIEMNPSNEHAHFLDALYRATMLRDHDGAMEAARRCLDVDPLSLMSNFSTAFHLIFVGEYELAAERASRTLLLYPDSPLAFSALGFAQVGLGRLADARTSYQESLALAPGLMTSTYLALVCGQSGDRAEALRIFEQLKTESGDHMPDFAQALIYIGLGDCDRALECLDRSLDARDSRIFWFPVLPGLDALRRDPRFDDLMRRVAAACEKSSAESQTENGVTH